MSQQRELFRDIGFSTVATPRGTHAVDFAIYDVVGFDDEDRPLFAMRGSNSFNPVGSVEESEPFASGTVKWDGCSDWHFDECERVMVHGCSRHDVTRIGDVLGRCWDMAAKMIDGWSGE